MKLHLAAALALALVLPPAAASGIDEAKVLANLRSAMSVLPNWTMRMADVQPSPIPGFYQAAVEFRSGENVRSQTIFVSSDSRRYIVGSLFDTQVDMDAVRRNLIRTEGSPFRGKPEAPVTVVEFSDLQCASCKTAHQALERDRILESYPGQIHFVYKHLPLVKFHPWALQAAVGAMCAHEQKPDAFWKMIDGVFAAQDQISADNLRDKLAETAKKLGLDPARFGRCYDGRKTQPQVERDMQEASAIGIHSTPTFIVNGRMMVGYPGPETFKSLIQEFLGGPPPR